MSGKCPMCGAPMKDNVCEYCGYEEETLPPPVYDMPPEPPAEPQPAQRVIQPQIIINNSAAPEQPQMLNVSRKSKLTALLLCIFLGIFGAHRFYVGKYGTGVIYLFSYGLFFIGWIYDIVCIARGTFTDKYGLPLRL